MPSTLPFTGSLWFATLAALLVSLAARWLIGAWVPVTVLRWLADAPLPEPLVLIAGVTSFWRADAIIRALSFGLGAWVACWLARSPSWPLLASLLAVAVLATAFAEPPGPVTPWQRMLWACAAPAAALSVGLGFRLWRGGA